jgi:hypothetical protein
MSRTRPLLLGAAIALLIAACGSAAPADPMAPPAGTTGGAADAAAASTGIVIERPAFLADLARVELLEPPVAGAGVAPIFSWGAIDGATTYRLTVLGPDGPRWGWEGPDTSIRYGAVEAGQRGPVIVPGSWWSVAAVDAAGDILATSDLRPVSPTDDPGPPPAWLPGAPSTTAADPVAQPDPAADPSQATASGPVTTETVKPCGLLSTAQIAEALGGEWSEPEESIYPHGKGGSCSWTLLASAYGGGLRVSISKPEAYDPAGWNGVSDPILDGIGEAAYLTRSGMDRKVGFVRGEVSVLLTFDHGDIDEGRYVAVARLVDAALR